MNLRGRLQRLLRADPERSADDGRWIVLDVESSGLDPDRDRLIAIAAIALRWARRGTGVAPAIALGDSFEAVLRQPETGVDRANILLHGVGVGEQGAGVDPRAVLESFEAWSAGAPLMAFHAPFDQRLLQRAAQAALGRPLGNAWLDLAPLAGVLLPELKARSLDEWLEHFELRCSARHQAAADTLVTAELFLHLWPLLQAELGARPAFRSLQRLAAQRRWLPH